MKIDVLFFSINKIKERKEKGISLFKTSLDYKANFITAY